MPPWFARARGRQPEHKIHRAVDVGYEVITATEVTTARQRGPPVVVLVDQARLQHGAGRRIVVADTKYGTVENYLPP
jgi:hypothetical protein